MNTKIASILMAAIVVFSLAGYGAGSLLAIDENQVAVEVGSAALFPGDTAVVPVTARHIPGTGPGTGLAAYNFSIAFDPAAMAVTAVIPGDAPFDDPDTFVANIGADTVTFAHFIAVAEGPHGDVVVANLVLKAIGAIGSISPLTLTITTLADASGLSIPAGPVHGSVLILGASFEAAPVKGAAPLAVQFTDLSPGAASAWAWDFGDGAASDVQHPSHVYDEGGSYTVSLTATWTSPAGSHTTTASSYINVIEADFEAAPTSGLVPLTVQFSDLSLGPSGSIDSWLWDFGDGATSTEPNPSHPYTSVGSYTVSLRVADSTYGIQDIEAREGYIGVVDMVAETEMDQEIGADNVALLSIKVKRAKNPRTGQTMNIPGGIRNYRARVEFDGAGIQILNVRGAGPFDSPSSDQTPGRAVLQASHGRGQGPPSGALAYLVPRLRGSANDTYTLTLTFENIGGVGGGGSIPQETPVVKTYRRGDTNSDEAVDIIDALFIAQYVVGLRLASGINAVNAAGVRWDDGGDVVDIFDALSLAQYIVRLRDANYNTRPAS